MLLVVMLVKLKVQTRIVSISTKNVMKVVQKAVTQKVQAFACPANLPALNALAQTTAHVFRVLNHKATH